MSCYNEMILSNENPDAYCGYIQDGFPGCGMCSDCCYRADYNDHVIKEKHDRYKEWRKNNPNKYKCTWLNKDGLTGYFEFRSSSLEKAIEVAQSSVYNYQKVEVTSC